MAKVLGQQAAGLNCGSGIGDLGNETQQWKPRVMLSYSHVDTAQCAKLRLRLETMSIAGLFHPAWTDHQILPGDEWDRMIGSKLDQADVILFLVSAASLASGYIVSKEMAQAFQREKDGSARVVPILLERCQWTLTPLCKNQALPTNAVPIRDWKPQRNGWNDVAEGLTRLFKHLRATEMSSTR